MKGLAYIDVAQPCDQSLVEQGCFQICLFAGKGLGHVILRQPIAEGLDAKPAKQLVRRQRVGRHQIHEAEAAHVVVDDARAIAHVEDDVVMRRVALGWRRRQSVTAACFVDAKPAAHTEMHDQDLAIVQAGRHIFGAALEGLDARALQPLDEALRQRKPQIRPPLLDALEPGADQGPFKPPAHRLYFWQFGHFFPWETISAETRLRDRGNNSLPHRAALLSRPWVIQAKLVAAAAGRRSTCPRSRAKSARGWFEGVFSRVAERYDLMNDLMSGGLHRLWKDDMIAWLAPPRSQSPYRLVDVAGGTGDIASRFLRAAGPKAEAVICDLSAEMLAVGRRRAEQAGLRRLSFVQANAEALPLEDGHADAYTIAFGIRNVSDRERALSEAYRILKPGGRLLVLEFSQANVPILDTLYERYSDKAIPAMGALVAGDADSYRYLVESIREFPDQETFAETIAGVGFGQVKYRNLSGGIAAIHSGWRL